jgi:hypothetical protein
MLIPVNGRTGVICETWALQAVVIPAKAGIYSANLRKCAVDELNSRFRGNDRRFQRYPSPNSTNTLMGENYSLEPVGIFRGFEMNGGFVP